MAPFARAAARTHPSFAGTRERAGTRPLGERDRVRARNDPQRQRSAAYFVHVGCEDDVTGRGSRGMTAYLISLALAGLIAIALWEGFS
jgi:hypothetical protein